MIDFSHPVITDAEIEVATRVLRSGQLAQGSEVATFEKEFAKAVGSGAAVAVANGTVAIEIGLAALGIGPGDEVIVPSLTFIATANAVRRVGARPVFADIDPKTYCISASTAEPHISPSTKAILAVHLYGHPADVDGLIALCEDQGIHLLEDAAQGIGAMWRDRSVGTFGTFATFSLYATKNVTSGEGGMITTSDQFVEDVSRSLRQHQSRLVEGVLQVGSNARMTDVEASIGRVQLSRLSEIQGRRRALADVYSAHLSEGVGIPYTAPDATHGFHLYTIRVPDRDRMVKTLSERGVGFGIYYPTPVHLTDSYRAEGIRLPDTEEAATSVLSLPIRPDLTESEQEAVIAAVNQGART